MKYSPNKIKRVLIKLCYLVLNSFNRKIANTYTNSNVNCYLVDFIL